MGEVYRARRADFQYHKEVTIKLVRAGFDSRFTLARFKPERQVLADWTTPTSVAYSMAAPLTRASPTS